jgi:fructokinase
MPKSRLRSPDNQGSIHEMSAGPPTVVSIGELLWDKFPDSAHLGGAPSNFAVHTAALGARSVLVSRVGMDEYGDQAIKILSEKGVNTAFLQRDPDLATGLVKVDLSGTEPEYDILQHVAWDAIEWEDRLSPLLNSAQAVCFGTLAQRAEISGKTIQKVMSYAPGSCLKVLDLNFRQNHHSADVVETSLHLADVVKLSEPEIPILRGYLNGTEDDALFIVNLRGKFSLDCVILSLGEKGCRVLGENHDFTLETTSRDVVNTVGAGDAFTAAFVAHRLSGKDPQTCAESANQVGGYVVTREDGMPVLPQNFRISSWNLTQ